MTAFTRIDPSLLGRWWWTIDRWTLAALAALIALGIVFGLAASPAVAERLNLDAFHFARRQAVFLGLALALVVAVSMLAPRWVRRLSAVVFVVALAMLAATLLGGAEVKGARRWLSLAGLSLQPSEFIKPSFAVVTAWLLTASRTEPGFPGTAVSFALFALVVGMLAAQPDVGMAIVVGAVWGAQFFTAGVQLHWAMLIAGGGLAAIAGAYVALPHVAGRIDRFLDPSSGDSYQVDRSIEAFMNGGLFGRGPGEGTVKTVLPDAHADFVFAVVGEEFGLIVCLIVVGLFAVVVLRGFARLLQETNLFVVLAATGLLVQFGLQAVINMGSALRLMPTKGMTLPFISYGGSSVLATALGVGMLLALTRRRARPEAW